MSDPACVADWIKELFDEQSDHISNHSRGPLEKAASLEEIRVSLESSS